MDFTLLDLVKGRIAGLEVLTQTPTGRGGVTDGGFVVDKDNAPWYLKKHSNPDHTHMEHLANMVYRSLGHHAPHSQVLHDPVSDRPVYLSKKIEKFKTLGSYLASGAVTKDKLFTAAHDPKATAVKFTQGFAADALLGNTDMHEYNVGLINHRSPIRIDNGAVLMYGPTGHRRDHLGVGFGSLETPWNMHRYARPILDPSQSAGGFTDHAKLAAAFQHPRVLANEVGKMHRLQEAHGGSWKGFVNEHIPGASKELRKEAASILDSRTMWLKGWVNGTHKKTAPSG